MSYQTILFDITDGIARLTLNRPERLNSFNTTMHTEVRQALASLVAESPTRAPQARVLVLTGAGRGFCAGQDLGDRAVAPGGAATERAARESPAGATERAARESPAGTTDLGESIEKYYKPLVLTLKNLPLPVIGAVNGVAAGAGANIALACDIVVAARSAVFVQAFAKLGLVPDSGGTWFLPRLLGTARAMGLAFFGDKLSAERAEQWGLIWRCVEDAEFPEVVDGMARQLAAAPTQGLARTKKAIHESWSRSLEGQLDIERDYQRELGYTADYAEGVAAFTQKRAPQFTGK